MIPEQSGQVASLSRRLETSQTAALVGLLLLSKLFQIGFVLHRAKKTKQEFLQLTYSLVVRAVGKVVMEDIQAKPSATGRAQVYVQEISMGTSHGVGLILLSVVVQGILTALQEAMVPQSASMSAYPSTLRILTKEIDIRVRGYIRLEEQIILQRKLPKMGLLQLHFKFLRTFIHMRVGSISMLQGLI